MKPHRIGLPLRPVLLGLTLVLALAVCLPALAKPTTSTAQPRQKTTKTTKPVYLTKDQINMIRVYEVHLDAKKPPRIDIPKKRLVEFLDEFKEDNRVPRGKRDREAWLRLDGHKQLALIFKVQARDYYKDVTIRGRLEEMRIWSQHHRRYILPFFQKYFGSGAVKGVYLFPQGRSTDQVEMTNFFILNQMEIDGKPMIDRYNPEESLLLQWGLPRIEAKYSAPDSVKNFRPYFKDTDDPKFKELVKWIKSLHRFNHGEDYDIKYKIPAHPAPKGGDKKDSKDDKEDKGDSKG